jgi:hypothetical protein
LARESDSQCSGASGRRGAQPIRESFADGLKAMLRPIALGDGCRLEVGFLLGDGGDAVNGEDVAQFLGDNESGRLSGPHR